MPKVENKKNKRKRQILKAKIGFLSLCPAGANTLRTVYKSAEGDENVELQVITKEMTEQGELICCVYAPDLEDSQGDQASAEVIKDFAYDFAKTGGSIDIKHNEEALGKDQIFVAESTIIQKGDPRFADIEDYDGDSVDVTGGWGVILKVEDEKLQDLYRSGEWGGISMGGMMQVRDISAETNIEKILNKIFAPLMKLKKQENQDMSLNDKDLKQVGEVVAKAFEARDVATTKKAEEDKIAKEKADKIAAEKADEKKLGLGMSEPVLKADPTEEDIAKHRRNLAIFELSKKVDPKDSLALYEFNKKAKEIATCEKLDDVLISQKGSSYERFYISNQDTSDVTSHKTGGKDEDPYVAAINKEMDEEDVAERKLKLAT